MNSDEKQNGSKISHANKVPILFWLSCLFVMPLGLTCTPQWSQFHRTVYKIMTVETQESEKAKHFLEDEKCCCHKGPKAFNESNSSYMYRDRVTA